MTPKSFPRTLIAAEAVLLFLLGILGSRMAEWLDLPPAVLIFSAVALLGALTAVTYAKVNYDPDREMHSISSVPRLFKVLTGSVANERLDKITRRRAGGGYSLFDEIPPRMARDRSLTQPSKSPRAVPLLLRHCGLWRCLRLQTSCEFYFG